MSTRFTKSLSKLANKHYRGWFTVVLTEELDKRYLHLLPHDAEKIYGATGVFDHVVGFMPFADTLASRRVYRMRSLKSFIRFLHIARLNMKLNRKCFVQEVIYEGHGEFGAITATTKPLGDGATEVEILSVNKKKNGKVTVTAQELLLAEPGTPGAEDVIVSDEDITDLMTDVIHGTMQFYSCDSGPANGMAQNLSTLMPGNEIVGYDCKIGAYYDSDVGLSVANIVNSGNRITYVNGKPK